MLGVKALAGKALYGLACIIAAVVLVVSGVAYYGTKAVNSLGTSPNLSGGPSTGPMNILIMGLESRICWDGTSVDHHIATILHTGTAADGNGGNAANTLILLHIFAGGHKAVGFSIPGTPTCRWWGRWASAPPRARSTTPTAMPWRSR